MELQTKAVPGAEGKVGRDLPVRDIAGIRLGGEAIPPLLPLLGTCVRRWPEEGVRVEVVVRQ
ncbi:MAG TPA: hypothetical protein VI336_00735 [Candidatus Saccharimonadales bacterium]|nr:hypothetical protein [Candidatus Saccharimonadales bacterium]